MTSARSGASLQSAAGAFELTLCSLRRTHSPIWMAYQTMPSNPRTTVIAVGKSIAFATTGAATATALMTCWEAGLLMGGRCRAIKLLSRPNVMDFEVGLYANCHP